MNGKSSSLLLISEEAVNESRDRCIIFDLKHAPKWIEKELLERVLVEVRLRECEIAVFCIGDLKCIEETLRKAITCS